MAKMIYVVLGSVMLSGTLLMAGVASDSARGASQAGKDVMDIPALERSIDLKALPNGDLDPDVYR